MTFPQYCMQHLKVLLTNIATWRSFFMLGVVSLLIIVSTFKSAVAQSDVRLDKCISEGTFLGRTTVGTIDGHDFNCKGLNVHPSLFNQGEYIYSAALSHRRTGATDDQLTYSFTITKSGEIRDFDIRKIKEGGLFAGVTPGQTLLLRVLAPIMAAQEWYLDQNDLTPLGNWEDAAYVLAASVANEAQESFQIAMTGKRRSPGAFEWMIDRPGRDYRRFSVPGSQIEGIEQCSATCLSEQQCKAWTYVRRGIQGNNAQCWLKNSVPDPSPMAGVVSGLKSDIALPVQPN